ncbi:hypothetical protein V6N12_074871 [Hibiscus sabdariffa]|uniref:Uncharacterized protein n=1 Tax=Hibiscus sabdariffa TaxID=183260 RepID=A0ABR2D2M6_9ROSI
MDVEFLDITTLSEQGNHRDTLNGLPVTLHKQSLIVEIGSCIGPVIHIDYQIESECSGKFVEFPGFRAFTLCVNLLSLIPTSSVSDLILQLFCSKSSLNISSITALDQAHNSVNFAFCVWLLVEKRQWCLARKPQVNGPNHKDMEFTGFQYNPIYDDSCNALDVGVWYTLFELRIMFLQALAIRDPPEKRQWCPARNQQVHGTKHKDMEFAGSWYKPIYDDCSDAQDVGVW